MTCCCHSCSPCLSSSHANESVCGGDRPAIATNMLDLAAPSSAELVALENLYRENLKLSEEEQKILNDEPNDVIKNVGILTALRTASESEPPRNPANSKSRNQKRQKIEQKMEMDGAADSPGPSPVATSAAASRLKGNTVRSVSVPTSKETKEVPVKIEEGAEGSKGPSAERAGKFFVGAEVAYKQAKMKEDGSQWIQCNIINITDIGNKKRSVMTPHSLRQRTYSPSQVRSTRPRTGRRRGSRTNLQDFGRRLDRHPAARHASSRLFDRQACAGTLSQHHDLLPSRSDGDEEGIVPIEVRRGPGPGDGGGPEICVGVQRQVRGGER